MITESRCHSIASAISLIDAYFGELLIFPSNLYNVRQACRLLNIGRNFFLAGIAESKRPNGEELLNKLTFRLQELQRIVDDKQSLSSMLERE